MSNQEESDFDNGVQTYTKCWLCDNLDWCAIPSDSGDWEGW